VSEEQSQLSIVVSASNMRKYRDDSMQLFEGGNLQQYQEQEMRNNYGQKQMHPLLSFTMLALAMIILTAFTIWTKLMI